MSDDSVLLLLLCFEYENTVVWLVTADTIWRKTKHNILGALKQFFFFGTV